MGELVGEIMGELVGEMWENPPPEENRIYWQFQRSPEGPTIPKLNSSPLGGEHYGYFHASSMCHLGPFFSMGKAGY